MQRSMRRKLLITLAGAACVPARAASDPLLPRAVEWVARLRKDGHAVEPYPISRLQRHLRTGYHRTCALMRVLEERGEWKIVLAPDGTRYARILPKGRA